MSIIAIREALETAVETLTPGFPTALENVDFKPTAAANQKLEIVFGKPANDEMSARYMERGFMQLTLRYPLNKGSGAAAARALLIRNAFPRNRAISAGSLVVTIQDTPEIARGFIEGDRYCIPVIVGFRVPV